MRALTMIFALLFANMVYAEPSDMEGIVGMADMADMEQMAGAEMLETPDMVDMTDDADDMDESEEPMAYDEDANPEEDIAIALSEAAQSGRRVMLVFGANWCPDCRKLDEVFKKDEQLKELLDEHFVVAKINIGRWDVNMDIADRYDKAADNGIPSVAILDAEGELISVTKARELATSHSMEEKEPGSIRLWFEGLVARLN